MSDTTKLVANLKDKFIDDDEVFHLEIFDGVGNFTPTDTKVQDPYSVDWNRFLPGVMDLERFFTVAAELIDDVQAREGVPPEKRVKLIEDFNPDYFGESNEEVITWSINRRRPGQMAVSGEGRPQRSYGFHANLRSAKHPTKILEIQSRPIDHEIEFSCWSKVNSLANSRVIWLEKVLIDYRYVFEVQGAERFWWNDRRRDTFWSPSGQRLAQRTLVFGLRLRDFRVKAHPMIRNINFETWISKS
jgi:hypothetical protein